MIQTSYEYFKNGGAKEMKFEDLPIGYKWITGCGGDGWYWNFFKKDEDLGTDDPKRVIMCKIKRIDNTL